LSVAVCRQTQLGLLRLLTNTTIMGNDVLDIRQSWDIYDALMSDERFEFYEEPVGLEQRFRSYTAGAGVAPKLWQDAYLAAFARSAKLHLVTFDRGFQKFEGLHLILLG
jgi:uncharacterized protein